MSLGADAVAILEALAEPALIVCADGTVAHCNRAAAALIGSPATDLRHATDQPAFEAYLRRCLGSPAPLVGAIVLSRDGAAQRFQCRGSRIVVKGEPAVFLRLTRADDERFKALTRKVTELNSEIAERRRAQAIAQETLRERELLLRELQHRVKNNMHMLAGMLMGAEREAASVEAKAALKDASLRFAAVSAVQQLLYGSENLETIQSEALMSALVNAAKGMATTPLDADVRVQAFELPIQVALPLALIVNELLTNAVKYGRPAKGRQKLAVQVEQDGGKVRVAISDNGPGFDVAESSKRASGVGLVRGLLRQLGGALTVERCDGARCTATIPFPEAAIRRSTN